MKEKNSARKYDKYLNLESFNNFDVIKCYSVHCNIKNWPGNIKLVRIEVIMIKNIFIIQN